MNKEIEKLLIEITELGFELEGVEFNNRFIGQGGITKDSLSKERKNLRAKVIRKIEKLSKLGADINDYADFSHVDENGIEWELDYALQFI